MIDKQKSTMKAVSYLEEKFKIREHFKLLKKIRVRQ